VTDSTGGPALSVVVLGYRNERTVADAVSSVLEQEAADAMEVIVVTSGNDGTGRIVRERFPAVTLVDSPERLLPGAARNAGVRVARGEHVAFLAADCRAMPGWAAARLKAHRAGYPTVAGAVGPDPASTPADWASHFLLFPTRLPGDFSQEISYPDDRTHGLSFARGALELTGPFRGDLRIGEDTEMARRLQEQDIATWFSADAVITHAGPRNALRLVRDQYARGVHKAKFAGAPPPRRLSRARAVAGAVWGGWLRLRWAQHQVVTRAPEQRRRLVRAMPLMVAGVAGHQAGWARARVGAIQAARDPGEA
jgi:glycosyltransferase involved in cell wall biosynthesis